MIVCFLVLFPQVNDRAALMHDPAYIMYSGHVISISINNLCYNSGDGELFGSFQRYLNQASTYIKRKMEIMLSSTVLS